MNIKIGGSPESWGIRYPNDPNNTPWNRFLDEVSEAGYNWIELGQYGYLPTNPKELRTELHKRGLNLTAADVMGHLEEKSSWSELQEQVLQKGELVASLGGEFIVLCDGFYNDLETGKIIIPPPIRLPEDKWKQLIETTHRIADLTIRELNLRLIFHPCADTHVQYEDEVEKFLVDTDPSTVSLCLDIAHHAYRLGDPVSFMRNHHERIPYVHLKSVDRKLCQKIESENIPFGTAINMGFFPEPSVGSVDFQSFRNVLEEINYDGFAIVEQDMYKPPLNQPPLIAKRTREFLRNIGMG